MVYGEDAVLPLEIGAVSLRVARQHSLSLAEYEQAMLMELDSVDEDRLTALSKLEFNKIKMARAYNKCVKPNEFVKR